MAPNSIHWFRKGLRLHDNPALREAVRGAGTVRCVYFLDPWFAGSSNVGVNRWRFLLQCLEDLDANLRKLNSRLFVIRGQPANVFPRLFKEWKISRLTFEYDSEPFGKERDAAIKKLAMEVGVEVIVKISHTLYDLDKIIELNGGQPPLTYKRFQTLISRLDPPEMHAETLSESLMAHCITPVSEDHGDKYGVPSLEELGFDTEGLPTAVWPGGETEALTRIERHLERKAWVANFERPRMNANSLLASPTGLSPYLRFGCLSCRLFYFKLTDLYRKVKKNSSPPLSLYGQLLWREFFYTAATNNPRFDKMEGNPICVRIPWDKNPEALAKWAEAKTGFPWIDAIMTQLRQEGWIHHLARHAVACFLTRGDLWISWEEGMKVFEELLLDADWSVNAGSWMWLSCSSFFQQFFHCYCPVGFGRRTDPNGDFIRRYLPVLRGFPAKFIYDPWNAPESVQAAARCVIGVHYPKPMVHHAEASRLNIERMKQIYQQLSRYRGLGLLASVPSTNGNGNGGMMAYSPGEQPPATNAGNNNNNGAPHIPGVSGGSVSTGNGSGSILLNFDSEEQPGGAGGVGQQRLQPMVQQHGGSHETHTHNIMSGLAGEVAVKMHIMCWTLRVAGYHSVPENNTTVAGSRLYHEFAVPQHPGLTHIRGSITGKRERESEREGSGEEESSTCSVHKIHKIQRQSTETT
ncbi:cryptochrome-1-like isoform X1 [Dunckerocampus dactyliophorus]|uniref:cryptochrome-1-like isoform X1 n=1 Tax=Dunckerocampus dactyliophorus TaxID=161453 RepID=UPI0024061778|nr:cryptochrome-1-like isoform X1 [Dunckerocampus dactyliophorus]